MQAKTAKLSNCHNREQQTVDILLAAWIGANDHRATMQAITAYILPPSVGAKHRKI